MMQKEKFCFFVTTFFLLLLSTGMSNVYAQIERGEGINPKYEFIITSNIFTGYVTPVGMGNYCQIHRLSFDSGHKYFFKKRSYFARCSYLVAHSGIGLLAFGIPISVAGHESYGHKRYSIALGSNPDDIFFQVGNEKYSAWGLVFLGYKYAKGDRAFTYGANFVKAEDDAAVASAGSLIQTNFAENLALLSERNQYYPSDFGMYFINKSWWTFYYFRKKSVINDHKIHRDSLEAQGIDVDIKKAKSAGIFSSLASGGTLNYLKSWYHYIKDGEISSQSFRLNVKYAALKLPEFSTFGRGNGYTFRVTLPIEIKNNFHINLITEKIFNGLPSMAGREYGLGIYYKTIENITIEWLGIVNRNHAYFTKIGFKFKIINNILKYIYNKESVKTGLNLLAEIQVADGYSFVGNDHLPGLKILPKQSNLTLGMSVDF